MGPTQMEKTPEDILAFWLDDLDPSQWYGAEEAVDQRVRDLEKAGKRSFSRQCLEPGRLD